MISTFLIQKKSYLGHTNHFSPWHSIEMM